MNRALETFVTEEIPTSSAIHQRILADLDFQAGKPTDLFLLIHNGLA